MRKSTWNTYATYGYSHDVANDQESAGGVHHSQVRHHNGQWQQRICQSNGRHVAYGPVAPINDVDGKAYYSTALNN